MTNYTFSDKEKTQMKKMAIEGKCFTDITLKVTGDLRNYEQVRRLCNANGWYSRQGIKKMSTQKLNELGTKKNVSIYSIRDIKACVNYIFHQNKLLEKKLEHVRMLLKVVERSKDPKNAILTVVKYL